MSKIYALYKGDKFIVEGTIEEIAKHQNVKKRTITFYGTKTSKNRGKGNRKELIRVE